MKKAHYHVIYRKKIRMENFLFPVIKVKVIKGFGGNGIYI